jgi:hypothetical protein
MVTKELVKLLISHPYILWAKNQGKDILLSLDLFNKEPRNCQAPVAHACKPSYSGGRNK